MSNWKGTKRFPQWYIKANCKKEAKKYNTRTDFRLSSGSCWRICKINGWLEEVCRHMTSYDKPDGYWNYRRCESVAKKCDTRTTFNETYPGAYASARKNGWLDDICSHMKSIIRWNEETVFLEALKYSTRTEFFHGSAGAYDYARDNKILDKVCSHMVELKKPCGYWTYERCLDIAKKCKSKKEFEIKFGSAFIASHRNGWIDDVCFHMVPVRIKWSLKLVRDLAVKFTTINDFRLAEPNAYKFVCKNRSKLKGIYRHMRVVGNNKFRCIYAFEFSDNHAYVGLTHDAIERHDQHLLKGPVNDHMYNTHLIPVFKKLTGYLPETEAVGKEEYYKNKYHRNGWIILNKARTGALGGGTRKWTKENLINEALEYTTRVEFATTSKGAYYAAIKLDILDSICTHMIPFYHDTWTYDCILEEAKKYRHRTDFYRNCKGAYCAARRMKCLDKVCKHMIKKVPLQGLRIKAVKNKKVLIFSSINDASRQLGIQSQNIGKVLLGKRNHVGGFTFKYA